MKFKFKLDKVDGFGLSTNDYTVAEKTKLSTLVNYTHPATHAADIIIQDTTHRFVSDTEKSRINTVGFSVSIFDANTSLIQGSGINYFVVPYKWNNFMLSTVIVSLYVAGTIGGTTQIQIRKNDNIFMLSSPITIAPGITTFEITDTINTSLIDPTNAIIHSLDKIFFDVLSKTTVAPKGLSISLEFSI